MAPHSSTLAWKIPWMEEPGRLQSMGLLRVRHDWATSVSLFTFHFHALEKEMATHSSVLAWRIPGTGEPGGLPSMGSHRVGHDWSDLAAAAVLFFISTVSSIILSAQLHKALKLTSFLGLKQVFSLSSTVPSPHNCLFRGLTLPFEDLSNHSFKKYLLST